MPSSVRWWSAAALVETADLPESGGSADWYRLGDGYLGVQSEDAPLRERCQALYDECRVSDGPIGPEPRVRCSVQQSPHAPLVRVRFDDPEPLDQIAFAAGSFPTRGMHERPSGVDGWRLLGLPDQATEDVIAVRDPDLLIAHRADAWQPFVGSFAVNRLLRLQRNVIFFHAASVGLRSGGVLIAGPKGAGKTTLSLALAARGYRLLGDELAGVRLPDDALLPIRRSVSVRPGPRAPGVDAALQRAGTTEERYPDGTLRLRAPAGALFPEQAIEPVRVRAVIFLRGRADQVNLEQVAPRREHLGLLPPLGSSQWGMSPGRRVTQVLGLLSRLQCWFVDAGSPQDTAAAIERHLEV